MNEQETGLDLPWRRATLMNHAGMLAQSFRRVVGRELIPITDEIETARLLYTAPFVVLSHGVEADPILNYGNAQALALWEMSFEEFTRMPSRVTAEPVLREERERLLAIAVRKGFIDDYSGVRISSRGRRFRIEKAIIWNVTDEQGVPRGQAATFTNWADA